MALNGRTHELKTWPKPFDAMWKMRKTHEIRKNDRGFVEGDTLILREWDNEAEEYTGRMMLAVVNYMTVGGNFGLPYDMVVMSVSVICKNRNWSPDDDLRFGPSDQRGMKTQRRTQLRRTP